MSCSGVITGNVRVTQAPSPGLTSCEEGRGSLQKPDRVRAKVAAAFRWGDGCEWFWGCPDATNILFLCVPWSEGVEKSVLVMLNIIWAAVVRPHVATHLVLHVCCLYAVLLLLATSSNWPHHQETSPGQDWRIQELGNVNNDLFGKEVSPFLIFFFLFSLSCPLNSAWDCGSKWGF